MQQSAESVVRDALSRQLLAETYGACDAFTELWVPRSNERADLAVIGRSMDGFEIKTEGDNLRRLPRQVAAYGRVFDRCTVVVADKHRAAAEELLPEWWGVATVHINGSVEFSFVRKARTNPSLDPEVLVRLLWRDEVLFALLELGVESDHRAPRASLWRHLLEAATLPQLRRAVRRAVLGREAPATKFGG